jgi:hypothetical protein
VSRDDTPAKQTELQVLFWRVGRVSCGQVDVRLDRCVTGFLERQREVRRRTCVGKPEPAAIVCLGFKELLLIGSPLRANTSQGRSGLIIDDEAVPVALPGFECMSNTGAPTCHQN